MEVKSAELPDGGFFVELSAKPYPHGQLHLGILVFNGVANIQAYVTYPHRTLESSRLLWMKVTTDATCLGMLGFASMDDECVASFLNIAVHQGMPSEISRDMLIESM